MVIDAISDLLPNLGPDLGPDLGPILVPPSKPNNISDVIEIDKLTRIKTIEFIKRKL